MKSSEFLNTAAAIQEERGKNYDQPSGERSAGRIAAAFNAITGNDLTAAEVYLLLQLTKDVRQWSSPAYHHDSALDCVSYAALKAEALFEDAHASAESGNPAPSRWLSSACPKFGGNCSCGPDWCRGSIPDDGSPPSRVVATHCRYYGGPCTCSPDEFCPKAGTGE